MTPVRVVVGGVVVDKSGGVVRVLAARRTGPPELAGQWEFPGGKVEDGESAENALARELKEELSISVSVEKEIRPQNGEHWPISATYVMRLFVCTIRSGEVTAGDSHDQMRWLETKDLRQVRWLASDEAALDEVEDAITARL